MFTPASRPRGAGHRLGEFRQEEPEPGVDGSPRPPSLGEMLPSWLATGNTITTLVLTAEISLRGQAWFPVEDKIWP